ncbi:Mitochondrial import inner membrane translocase subunit TIM22-2 [Zea mays]|uniref:Mitochondrial import inner membrane translocase subunit TIM22-2 n=1 Tax=Zea mays TaxID=4577 RepID=A0A1D6IWW4_MAIZE|nr:Mitochondrial import inner membrane translocase subunit TIM22-2 [Zea mays]
MARGGGDRSREDDPFSDGGTTETDSDESSPRGVGARGPGSTSNPILTRLAVSRNSSPLAAATAAPGVCLLRFAWESAAGSLVGAVVGYGFMAHRWRGNVWLWRHFEDLRCGLGMMGLDSVRLRLCSPDSSVTICLISIVLLWTLFCCSPWG